MKKAKKGVKVVINTCYGGFGLSEKASVMFNELENTQPGDENYIDPKYGYYDGLRHNKSLVKVVEKLKKKSWGTYAELVVVKLTGNKYIIEEYDGTEGIQEPNGINWITV